LGAANFVPKLEAVLDAAPVIGSSIATGSATQASLYRNGARYGFNGNAGDALTLLQLHAQTSSTNQPYRAVTRAFTVPRFTSLGDFTNVVGLLTAPRMADLSIQYGRSAFKALLPLLNPVGVDGGDRISLLSRNWAPSLGWTEKWDGNDPALLVVDLPPGTGDVDLGLMTYGDPFDRGHALTVSQEIRVPMSLPGVLTPAWAIAGVSVEDDPSGLALSNLQPIQGPVLNPRINGLDAFSGSLTFAPTEAPVTFTWDPPALGIPADYIVDLVALSAWQGQVLQRPIRRVLTRETSIAIPLGLLGAYAYYATITAQQADGDLQRTPYRIPHRRASATVVTARITRN
jgi:hypothetical protein